MKTLFIDLASHSDQPHEGACMACVTKDTTASIRFLDHRIGDDGLMAVLDETLKEARWHEKDLTQIACVTGPGGFTSLRMAVTLANVLADQMKIPSVGIHLSDLYQARGKQPEANSFCWIHATKKEAVFIQGFGSYADQWSEPTLVTMDELIAGLPDHAAVTGEILPGQRERLSHKKIIDIPLRSIAETLPSLLSNQSYDQSLLSPWYGRGW